MLETTKSITLNGNSTFDGVIAQTYQAVIDSNVPENMTLSNWIGDYAVYKNHRIECSTERSQFEDKAYELQEEAIAEKTE